MFTRQILEEVYKGDFVADGSDLSFPHHACQAALVEAAIGGASCSDRRTARR